LPTVTKGRGVRRRMNAKSNGSGPVQELRFRIPAIAERLNNLRRALTEWATRIGLAAETVSDLVLATYEAMANVVEHAYRDHVGGLLDLHAHANLADGTVTVSVTDYGRWRPPPDPGLRGRGLRLIHGLTQHTAISPGPHGTTVTMTYRLA
jgi:serine/threonine-protein kinase RsbW